MKRLRIPLFTVISMLAGWYFAQAHRSMFVHAAVSSAVVTPTAVRQELLLDTGPDSLEIAAAVERLLKEPKNSLQREELVAHFFAEVQDLDSSEFPSAIAAIAATGSVDQFTARELAAYVAGLWAERDLPAARKWLLGLEKSQQRHYGLPIFETWSRLDAQGMFAWLETNADEIKEDALRNVAGFFAAKTAGRVDPERGFKILKALEPDLVVLGNHGWNLYRSWAQRDPAAAAARSLQEPTDSRRADAIRAVVDAWSTRDPAAARAWADGLPDPVLSGDALVRIGGKLGLSDWREGADFLASIPQNDIARESLREVLNSWKKQDLNAVIHWTAALPDGPLGLWALKEMTKELPPDKFESAIALLPPEQRSIIEERWRQAQRSTNPGGKVD